MHVSSIIARKKLKYSSLCAKSWAYVGWETNNLFYLAFEDTPPSKNQKSRIENVEAIELLIQNWEWRIEKFKS